jgi:hypothetical protein
MKTIIFAMSMLTMSCTAAVGLPAGDDGAMSTSPQEVVQQSPSTADACRACHGDWGVHGLSDATSQTESCNCGTNDGGKRCTDGTDCQGMCVANSDNPEYDAVDSGPPARGFLVGRCSYFVTVYGCNALVESGARDAGPASVAEPPPVLCVD